MIRFHGKALVVLIFLFGAANRLQAQVSLNDFLVEGMVYAENIPDPKSVIGHEIGEWHISHDKLVHYFYVLASKSERVRVEKYAESYELRPLLNVIITSPENHDKLEQLRLEHAKLSDPAQSNELDISSMPVVIRLGYSVHGNEASGANASLLVAYHLAAAQGEQINNILNNCLILIDPSLNPDGLQRFSTWVNSHRSKNPNADPNNREFREPWPNGRTNHYWFDLNRDWLLAQQPESIGRLKLFHDWKPNVQTDHHEMESDATFFFQPGVPSRNHPLIPGENVKLTEKIASYHAKAMDDKNRLYFSREVFDDFYFGKGSTYPDLHGSIGILFEQASVRGHLRQTANGQKSFAFAIKNHFITSLSTIKASYELKEDLLNYQRNFYNNSEENSGQALLLGADDPSSTILLGQVLLMHQIKIHQIKKDVDMNSVKYSREKSLVIPLNQPQSRLIRALFERRTSFADSVFYDISAWDFDLAYNIQSSWINEKTAKDLIGDQITELEFTEGEILGTGDYAYAMEWDQYFAPAMINQLLNEGLKLKVATKPFTTTSDQNFNRGTILIPNGIQELDKSEVEELLAKYASSYHIKVIRLNSGLSTAGIDLGSNSFLNIRKPTIAMLVDRGVSGSEAGEVWHLLDQRYDMEVTMLSTELVDRIKLNKYNVLLLPGGSYNGLNNTAEGKIKDWVKEGGTLIAWRDALRLTAKLQVADLKFKKVQRDTTRIVPYADRPNMLGAQVIGGAIFNMELDTSHPLAYGYQQKTIPVFKRGTLFLENAKNIASNPFRYTDKPLISGYISKENLALLSGSPAVNVASFGEGRVIAFTDNHLFRAFWFGTNRLFINGIFFGDKISTR